jgi:hypothetical protein
MLMHGATVTNSHSTEPHQDARIGTVYADGRGTVDWPIVLPGLGRLLAAVIGVSAIFVAYAVLFPLAIMYVVLLICRFIPLAGWRSKPRKILSVDVREDTPRR